MLTEHENSQIIDLVLLDIQRIASIGEILTIQISFDILSESERTELGQNFMNSLGEGRLDNDLIFIQEFSSKSYDEVEDLLRLITSILTEGIKRIDEITALLELNFRGQKIMTVVGLNSQKHTLEILSSADNAVHFEIVKLIQTKWLFSKSFIQTDDDVKTGSIPDVT
ncbi:MAG: hypothetical protein ACTSYA_11940 [Candidatus Kariarchaeaceae archaeon]